MLKPIAPCKDCESKFENCHTPGECVMYDNFKKSMDSYNNFIRRNKQAFNNYINSGRRPKK